MLVVMRIDGVRTFFASRQVVLLSVAVLFLPTVLVWVSF